MNPKSTVLDRADLEALILGACFFGSGGGGTLTSARSLLSRFERGDYYPSATVSVVSPKDATEGDSVVVAYMGAPARIDTAAYPIGPVKAVEKAAERLKRENRELKYIVPPESGALGFLVACLVAAKFGLSVVDADGAGRAVPCLPMLTFAAEGVSPDPAFVVSQGGLAVELDVEAPQGKGGHRHQQDLSTIVEHMLRPIISEPEFGQFGGLALWLMEPTSLTRALPITGTLTRALELGRRLSAGQLRTVEELLAYLHESSGLRAFSLFEGILTSACMTSTGGFDVGQVVLEGGAGHTTVLYQNESLLAWDDQRPSPLAMAPDTIAYFLPNAPGHVASNGDLVNADGSLKAEYVNSPAIVVGVVADLALRRRSGPRQEGLILKSFLAQLASMGYLGSYTPVEELNPHTLGSHS